MVAFIICNTKQQLLQKNVTARKNVTVTISMKKKADRGLVYGKRIYYRVR